MKPLHPENIKAELRKKFGTLRAFERAKGLPTASTVDVLRGRAVTRTAKAIAVELGVPLNLIIGNSKPQKSKPFEHNKSRKMDCHCLNEGAQ